jgi:hypothetical protein
MLFRHGTKPPGKIVTNPEVLGFRTFVNDYCASTAGQIVYGRRLNAESTSYYSGEGSLGNNDFEEPDPVSFLAQVYFLRGER